MRYRHWTPEEDQVLRDNLTASHYALGVKLHKDLKTVARRREKLGLSSFGQRFDRSVFPGSSQFDVRPRYRVEGWTPQHGPPCRSCKNYPPAAYDFEVSKRIPGYDFIKPVCVGCESRLEWCQAQ